MEVSPYFMMSHLNEDIKRISTPEEDLEPRAFSPGADQVQATQEDKRAERENICLRWGT